MRVLDALIPALWNSGLLSNGAGLAQPEIPARLVEALIGSPDSTAQAEPCGEQVCFPDTAVKHVSIIGMGAAD